jgi:hypothetical protein
MLNSWRDLCLELMMLASLGATGCVADEEQHGDATAFIGTWKFTEGIVEDLTCVGGIQPTFSFPLASQKLALTSPSDGRLSASFLGCRGLALVVDGQSARLDGAQRCELSGSELSADGEFQELVLTRDGQRLRAAGRADLVLNQQGMALTGRCPALALDGAVAERESP